MDVSSDDFRISQKIREDQARKKRAATKIFEETVNRVGRIVCCCQQKKRRRMEKTSLEMAKRMELLGMKQPQVA